MARCGDIGAYLGKDIQIGVFVGCSDVTPDPEDYLDMGWRRDLSFSVEWGDEDVTTAGTVGSVRDFLQNFKEISGDFSGLSKRDEGLKTLRHYITTSTTGTDGWVRLVIPDASGAVEVFQFQCIFTSHSTSSGYDASGTADMGWKAVAEPIYDELPSYTIVLDPTAVSFVSGVGDTVDVEMSDTDVDAAVSVRSSAVGLTATVNNTTNVITLASSVVGAYTVTVTSLVNNKVTATLPVTVTAS